MTYIINGKNSDYELVIGCEIHAQISSNSKLFSRSSTKFGSMPNSQVSLVDCGMPGMLPTLNQECVYQAIKTGLAIGGTINLVSHFDRKNYFYPDLPQGYQISQFFTPIVTDGLIEINLDGGNKKTIRIERIHLEQDAGKLIHDQHPQYSLVDLNRAGVALMEIVSKPDIATPEEASIFVKTVRDILRSINASDGDMEKGNLRCDANVSVRKVGETKLGTRCEIKNLNSMRNIARAIIFEAERQVKMIESGIAVEQETRLFDVNSGETSTMRSKEDAMDYRYFPDPDLPPLVISQSLVDEIKKTLPELPNARKSRYITQFGLNSDDANLIVASEASINYFEALILKHEPKSSVTWLTVELFGRLNKNNIDLENSPVKPERLILLIDLIKNGEISSKIAKDILDEMMLSNEDPQEIVNKKGLKQVSNSGEIEKIIDKILNDNPNFVAEYKAGKEKLFGFFIGQIMKEAKGKANPSIVNEILINKLK